MKKNKDYKQWYKAARIVVGVIAKMNRERRPLSSATLLVNPITFDVYFVESPCDATSSHVEFGTLDEVDPSALISTSDESSEYVIDLVAEMIDDVCRENRY